jgi:hypothetical protein
MQIREAPAPFNEHGGECRAQSRTWDESYTPASLQSSINPSPSLGEGELTEDSQQAQPCTSFQFSPIPVRNGELLAHHPTGARLFQDAGRSAFESSQGALSDERRASNESESAASCFVDAVSNNGAASQASAMGSKNGLGSCKLSQSPSFVEQKDNGNGDQPSAPFKRVEFSELRKRFEEAHASGILRDTRA